MTSRVPKNTIFVAVNASRSVAGTVAGSDSTGVNASSNAAGTVVGSDSTGGTSSPGGKSITAGSSVDVFFYISFQSLNVIVVSDVTADADTIASIAASNEVFFFLHYHL